MLKQLIVKKANNRDIEQEIISVGFDSSYSHNAADKYKYNSYKIFNLKAHEANILKQLCLSLGFDCAVSRETITCQCEYTNCIMCATTSQLNKLIKKLKIQPFRLKALANEIKQILDSHFGPLLIRNTIFDWSKPYIMGILNITPDSFSDGGEYYNIDMATNRAVELINDGADIIDIGGESTRPGAEIISQEEEIARVVPVIKSIRAINQNIPISIDTRNYLTAKEAISAGADIINDVSGLNYDKELSSFLCKNKIPVIIMHSDKVPAVRSENDSELDVIEDIYKYFYEKINFLTQNGLCNNQIIIDPGIGFGKSINDNFKILKRIDEFSTLNCPLLMGISRKSFISKSFDLSKEELDEATLTYNSFLLTKNVNIIRVHNVKSHKRNIDLLSKVF